MEEFDATVILLHPLLFGSLRPKNINPIMQQSHIFLQLKSFNSIIMGEAQLLLFCIQELPLLNQISQVPKYCLLYTSDAADE